MFSLVVSTILIAAVVGLIVKFLLDYRGSENRISWREFSIGLAAISFVLVPLITWAGWTIARSNLLTYKQYLNGWELRATRDDIACTRDGSCVHCYDCDPYTVMVSYECGSYSGSGNNRHYVSRTCWRQETRYHSCPYVDVETSYFVRTTLGDYTISLHRFPENPQEHRWRQPEGIPDYAIANAGVGIPQFWAAVKSRVDSGRPGPVSKRAEYENYILASEQTILKQHSSDVDKFLSAGLLPRLNSQIYDFYAADKVYFVGYRAKDSGSWQRSVSYLNAAFGSELEGDLHLVIVENDKISENPESYALALKAYWQSSKVFEENALSKNALVIIVGTRDGETVAWARAFTGMPIGNETLTVAVQNNLKGVSLTPWSLVGETVGGFDKNGNAVSAHKEGALEILLWGFSNPGTKFVRRSMSAKDKNDVGRGFLYLKGEIQPTPKQKFWIGFFAFIACTIVWVVCICVDDSGRKRSRYDYY